MRRSLLLVGVAAALTIAWSIGLMQGQKKAPAKKVIFVSSAEAKFTESDGGRSGSSMARIWGDPDKGAHGTFTKFAPGFDAGMHTHTNDVYLYKDDAGEKRVGPGDFLRVPGGHKHWSGGDKSEGALFYEEGSAKFDLVPAK